MVPRTFMLPFPSTRASPIFPFLYLPLFSYFVPLFFLLPTRSSSLPPYPLLLFSQPRPSPPVSSPLLRLPSFPSLTGLSPPSFPSLGSLPPLFSSPPFSPLIFPSFLLHILFPLPFILLILSYALILLPGECRNLVNGCFLRCTSGLGRLQELSMIPFALCSCGTR